ncbi:cytochrome P450 [Sphaerospermopsis aphanizomenoides BCCUSP55]|uniref:cytochrome P450 n=1 Tax=Sphaerospermopsis aphanizomenoides TaxID=459663 RepID=UPI001906DDF2|nr:cytochrome P450 [Sphaerospermopsis aphanizomenoides]MBK1989987.1 cytochrome P450 [Sphaerospermopsis aphanizomenoides BCCUSP55]
MVTLSPSNKAPNYPPGPKAHPLLGSLPDFGADPLGFLSQCAKDYGDIVLWKSAVFSMYQLNHPDYIEEAQIKKLSLFKKHRALILKRIWGNGLFVSEGELWQRQRRLMQPAFHRERIFSYGEVMIDYTNRMLKTWHEGEIRDIHEDMMYLTLEIVAKTLFGTELIKDVEQVGKAMQVSIEYFESRNTNLLLYLIPDWVPLPHNLRYQQAVQQFDNLINRIIQQKRESAKDSGDLLSMLLNVQDEDGTRMTDTQIRDELITLLIAGHETTALALSWACYLLSQHPEVEQKLLTELQTVLGGRTPTFADLPKLIYTERIIMEVMRLYPPVWAMSRRAVQDCEIGGYPLRAGDGIIVSQWVMHHDPRYFDQPEVFNPDRWENDLAKKLPTFAYFPFGGGPRICIGQSFAKMEAMLILATIAQQFKLSLAANHEVVPWPAFTLRPKYGVKMLLNQR